MLRLTVRDLDIGRISILLGKNKLKASITNSTIIIDSDEIADEIIEGIVECATIISAQNYQPDNEQERVETETEPENGDVSEENPTQVPTTAAEPEAVAEVTRDEDLTEQPIEQETHMEEPIDEAKTEVIGSKSDVEDTAKLVIQEEVDEKRQKATKQILEPDMLCRGEVYQWGDIREYEDQEGTIKECVIIIQNDYQMSYSEDTIALLCTSNYDERAPIHFPFSLTEETMEDYSGTRLEEFRGCTLFVGHIQGINRSKIGRYLGTLNSRFMNTLQPAIDFCLGLKRSRSVNRAQLQMLSTVNQEEMIAISNVQISNFEKVTEFLKLFKFDMTKNGVEYVRKAILIAHKKSNYILEDLAETIAKQEQVNAEEVLRLIVARIKENFHFKKSSAISFIRLVDKLLEKG